MKEPYLPPRKRTIALMVRDGLSNKEIAHTLGLGLSTVSNAMTDIMARCGVTNRVALAVQVARWLRVDDDPVLYG